MSYDHVESKQHVVVEFSGVYDKVVANSTDINIFSCAWGQARNPVYDQCLTVRLSDTYSP